MINFGATEIAGVDSVARRSKSGQSGSGQDGTKKLGVYIAEVSDREKIMYYWRNPYMLKNCSMFKLKCIAVIFVK